MGWKQAGEAWGDRSTDWACLWEPATQRASDVLFDQLDVGPGVRLVDVACGSGRAGMAASWRGASVSGLDASEKLIAIARARTPDGEFRVGDMFDLPFDDDEFDVATSFNGIWKGCEAALIEARRVVRPGGTIGITYWGSLERMGLLPFFMAVMALSSPDEAAAIASQGETQAVAVEMFTEAGIEIIDQGTIDVIHEWPDLDLAVRALASTGPSWPVLQLHGEDKFREAVGEALLPSLTADAGVRVSSEFGWTTGRVPE